MAEIGNKNRLITEMKLKKSQIESKVQSKVEKNQLQRLQEDLEHLIADYERAVGERLDYMRKMINELDGLQQKNITMAAAREDIFRAKNAIDLV